MDAPDKPADPKEVELTAVDELTPPKSNNQERLTVLVEITFWTHVGSDGMLVMLFSLGLLGCLYILSTCIPRNFKHGIGPGFGYLWSLLCCTRCCRCDIFLRGKKSPSPILKISRHKRNHSFVGKFLQFIYVQYQRCPVFMEIVSV